MIKNNIFEKNIFLFVLLFFYLNANAQYTDIYIANRICTSGLNKQFQSNLAISLGNRGVDLHMSFSPANNLVVLASGNNSIAIGKKNKHHHFDYEVGTGYYSSGKKINFEALLLYCSGTSETKEGSFSYFSMLNLSFFGDISSNYRRYSFQPTIEFKKKRVIFFISQRIGMIIAEVKGNKIDIFGNISPIDEFDNEVYAVETAFTFKFGWDQFKITLQPGVSLLFADKIISGYHNPFLFSVGVQYILLPSPKN